MSERSLDLKRRLGAGESVVGAWLTLADSVVAEVMASTGFDLILIDTEHGPFSIESLQTVLMAFRAQPTVPMVRVPWNDPVLIKQALDVGAEGILIPMVRSAEEARRAVAACKYPPEGIRGFGPRRASDYGRNVDDYVETANESIIVMPQLEHVDAARDIEAILDVPGVDCLCIGPNDLSGSAGYLRQLDHPVVADAINRILDAAKARGIAVAPGIALPDGAQPEWTERGATIVLATDDLGLVVRGAKEALARARAVGA